MGLSGGSSSTSSSVTGSAQDWAKPYATSQAANTMDVFNRNQSQLQGLADDVYRTVPGLAQRFASGSPSVKAAQGYNTDVLSGKYLTGNPQLQAMIDAAKRGVTDSVDSQFSSAGRYGSGAFTDVLSRNLAEAEAGLRYTDYNNQMGRMDTAASQAPALSQADYIGLPELLQTATTGAALPYVGTSASADALGALFNGGTQTSTEKRSGGLLGGLGSILSGVGAMGSGGIFSDRRLKREIELTGREPDGLGRYRFAYLWDEPGTVRDGVMADEVADLRPWALGPVVSGYATVNMEAL